jgi:hypothetical protein
MVLQLLRNPESFMDRKVGQPSLRLEIVVVLIVGALGALGQAYIGLETLSIAESETLRFPVIGITLEPIIGALILWIGYAVGLHLVSNKVFRARGSPRRLLKLTAWALMPLGVGNLLRSAVMYVAFSDLDYEQTIADATGSGRGAPLNAVMAEGTSDPLILLAPLVVVLSAVASGYLLVYAVQTVKDLDRDEAVKTAGVIVGLHALYVLWGAVGLVGNL